MHSQKLPPFALVECTASRKASSAGSFVMSVLICYFRYQASLRGTRVRLGDMATADCNDHDDDGHIHRSDAGCLRMDWVVEFPGKLVIHVFLPKWCCHGWYLLSPWLALLVNKSVS